LHWFQTALWFLLLLTPGRAADLTIVSAASYKPSLSPASMAAVFNLPFDPQGAAISVTDSAGVSRNAAILGAGSAQINFRMPTASAIGAAVVNITSATGQSISTTVQLVPVSPGFFSANGTGRGVASAVVVQLAADGSTDAALPVFKCGDTPGSCVPAPITVSPTNGRTILELFGTGIRGRSRLGRVSCRVGRALVPVLFAGAQGSPGLDQVNVVLPSNLAGAGNASVVLTVDDQTSNSVTINLSATTFYVSPTGDDAYTGLVPSRSFATLAHAQEAARGVPNARILLRGGVYTITQPLAFIAADSNITWESYPDETPVISGGRAITGWTPSTAIPGAWEASIDGFLPFEQLWVGDQRRYRVRVLAKERPGYFHNLGPVYVTTATGCTNPDVPQGYTQSFMVAAGKYECFDRFFFRTGDIDPTWTGLSDPKHPIEIVDFEAWTIARIRLASIGDSSGIAGAPANSSVAYLARATVAGTFWGFLPGHRYLIDNVKEALTPSSAGEWYIDGDRILYVPTDDEDFAGDPPDVIAPQANQLLVAADPSLTNLTFRGLTFSHSNWIAGSPGYSGFTGSQQAARENVPAALSFTRASKITLEGVTLSHLGGWGLEFIDASDCRLSGSVLTDLGSGGIRLGAEPTRTDTDINVTQSTTLSNNLLAGGDRMLPGVAITIENSHDNVLDHNEIYDFYNQAINLGRALNFDANGLPNWVHDNHITSNLIHDIGQGVTSDMGAVHTATGLQTGNLIDHNTFHDIAHDPTGNGYGGWGIYLDQGSSFVTVTNNLVYNTLASGFTYNASLSGTYQLNGTPNTVANNIFAFGSQASIHRNNNDGALNFTFENNIVYWDQTHPIAGQPDRGPSPQDGTWACATAPVTCFAFSQNMYYSTIDPNMTTWRFITGNRTLTFAQWQASPQPAEDAGSSVNIDPLFVAPATGDFTLQSGSPATALINFQPFDFRAAGRLDATVKPPTVPPGFPLQLPASY
jgi:uncharacterized protein (TIGR03437 family)